MSQAPTAVALAGLAPYDRDSGKERGERDDIFGGRGQIRTCLYMAALAAIRSHAHFREFAERLTRRGKPFKVAVTRRHAKAHRHPERNDQKRRSLGNISSNRLIPNHGDRNRSSACLFAIPARASLGRDDNPARLAQAQEVRP